MHFLHQVSTLRTCEWRVETIAGCLIGLQSHCPVKLTISFPAKPGSPRRLFTTWWHGRGHPAVNHLGSQTGGLKVQGAQCVSPDKKCLLTALQSERSTLHLLTKEGGELFFCRHHQPVAARVVSAVWAHHNISRLVWVCSAHRGQGMEHSVLSSWSKRATNYDILNMDAGQWLSQLKPRHNKDRHLKLLWKCRFLSKFQYSLWWTIS